MFPVSYKPTSLLRDPADPDVLISIRCISLLVPGDALLGLPVVRQLEAGYAAVNG